MRLHKPRRSYGCEINMTPMIDIIFQLIIFFMTATQLVRIEAEDLALPEAGEGEQVSQLTTGPVVVNVHEDGRIVISHQTVRPAGLGPALAEHLKQRAPADRSVVIRGDRNAAWEKITTVLQACAGSRIGRVRVAVVEPPAQPSP